MWLGQKLQERFAAPGMPPVHIYRPSTFSYAGYTSTLYVFSILFMLEALAKEIAESLGGLFHPMNFSTQLLPVSLFLLEIFQSMPSSGSILCLQNSWH